MLGRKSYTQEELDRAKTAIDRQLAAYEKLVNANDSATSDPEVTAALDAFEPLFLNPRARPLFRPQAPHGHRQGRQATQ
jgi:hypothetical protein